MSEVPQKSEGEPTPDEPSGSVVRFRGEFIGPIPPPAMVKEFEQLLPGAAERLFRMAEKEQDHRHENDHRGYGYFSRGQWMALTIAILVLCVAAYMVSQGQGLIGLGTILIGLGPIIYTLMTGLKNGASENKE